jgi:hypothetical protein
MRASSWRCSASKSSSLDDELTVSYDVFGHRKLEVFPLEHRQAGLLIVRTGEHHMGTFANRVLVHLLYTYSSLYLDDFRLLFRWRKERV